MTSEISNTSISGNDTLSQLNKHFSNKQSDQELLKLITAADYLDISRLLDTALLVFANRIKAKSEIEIRNEYGDDLDSMTWGLLSKIKNCLLPNNCANLRRAVIDERLVSGAGWARSCRDWNTSKLVSRLSRASHWPSFLRFRAGTCYTG